MNLYNLIASRPLIENGLLYARDSHALKEWAALNREKFGVGFFLTLQAMIRLTKQAGQQESSAWGNSIEDRMAYSFAQIKGGGSPAPDTLRLNGLYAVGGAALKECGPRVMGWAKSGLEKFFNMLKTLPEARSGFPEPQTTEAFSSGMTPAARRSVFLSHSRRDLARSGVLKIIENHLASSQTFSPWIDHHGIEVGDALFGTIRQAIQDCFAVALLWSENASKSASVLRELEFARQFGKPIIPCLIEEPQAHFSVPGDMLGIQFFPSPGRIELAVAEFNAVLLSRLTMQSRQPRLPEDMQHVQNLQAELDHHAVRAASVERPDTVHFVKSMLRTLLERPMPPEMGTMQRFLELLLRQLEMDHEITTNDELITAARYCQQRVDPKGEHPELGKFLAGLLPPA